jgi:cellulose synthase/poly-beta-1,6-N-acetylglucosamine synthase-like glycosyltransferase
MMQALPYIGLLVIAIILLLYLFQLLKYALGWMKLNIPNNQIASQKKIAIIIAVRNEEKNIATCLNSLLQQNYPKNLYDVIIVNDSSDDGTVVVVEDFVKKHSNVFLIHLETKDGAGKKNAIQKGIQFSDAEIVITTDGDCWMQTEWLSSMARAFENDSVKMVVGPVTFSNEKTVFEKMQSLEFMALVASTGGAIQLQKPIMCNGANLAYLKQSFLDLNGFSGIDGISTGDDVLLMYKLFNQYPDSLSFLKDKRAIVYTSPKSSISDFIEQRKRWASKPFSLLNSSTQYTSILVFLTNFFSILLIVSLFCFDKPPFHPNFGIICLILIGIKCIIDFLLLFLASSFFGKRKLLIYFLPEQLLYMFYVVFVGLLSKTKSFSWKGRELKN